MLRDLQDSFAESLQSQFSVIQRGCIGSKAKHIDTKKFYSIMNENNKETDIEVLKAKATREELLKMKLNYMDKTLKSFQHFNRKKDETNEELLIQNQNLLKEIQELKKNMNTKENILKNDDKKTIRRGFTGKRYNKSV